MKNIVLILFACVGIGCLQPHTSTSSKRKEIQNSTEKIALPSSVQVPLTGAPPKVSQSVVAAPSKILNFSAIGERFSVKNGENVNIVYDGINPENYYIRYESTFDGYDLELAAKNENIMVEFHRMCQVYIVANPALTSVVTPENLRYEQIVWTPRADGTWEVRVGAVERGCKSEAVEEINKLRNKEYERNIPRK